jgi:hypothetical protein
MTSNGEILRCAQDDKLACARLSKKSLREKISDPILRVDERGISLAFASIRKRATHFSQIELLAAESPQTTN